VRAEHVGFVFQSFQLLDSLNALENVMLPLELDGRRDAREQARTLLERVGLGKRLSHTRHCPAANSSAWPLPAPSPHSLRCCLPTNPPATSTATRASASATCCSN
jgi:hypothetical protein